MLLSIIIPVYKTEKYIEKCLLSIIPQLTSDVEIIIVNDGTPDNSMEIIKKLIVGIKNIRIISQKNMGLSMARNTGLSAAQGDYVWFVDSDDYLLGDAIQRVCQTIDENPGVEVISSILLMEDEFSNKRTLEWKSQKYNFTGKDYLFKGLNYGASQRYIIKKTFLEDNHLEFMPDIYHEDGEFGPRMLYLANRVLLLEHPVYVYLQRSSGSIMSNRKPKMNDDLIKIYYSLDDFCQKYVNKKDEYSFKLIMYRILLCAITFSFSMLDTSEYRLFWQKNKYLFYKKARELVLHPFELPFKTWAHLVCCSFSPLITEKLIRGKL